MYIHNIPVIGICAYSGTGKTTLLSQLIPYMKNMGLRLSVIKHGHHAVEIDKPGKDSFIYREVGADEVIIASRNRIAMIRERPHRQDEPSLEEALQCIQPNSSDLILVEGYKQEAFPKIELIRPILGHPLLFPVDPNVIAIACDDFNALQASIETRTIRPPSRPYHLDLNNTQAIAEYIVKHYNIPTAPKKANNIAL